MSYESKVSEFVTESNRIEGIKRPHTDEELAATLKFLDLLIVRIADLEEFVQVCAGASLRTRSGMNVRVGDHVAPRGGPRIADDLSNILGDANTNNVHPYLVHVGYETLHPFSDGNGRSGRVLWAWQMLRHDVEPGIALGFLHSFYYQALSHSRRTE